MTWTPQLWLKSASVSKSKATFRPNSDLVNLRARPRHALGGIAATVPERPEKSPGLAAGASNNRRRDAS